MPEGMDMVKHSSDPQRERWEHNVLGSIVSEATSEAEQAQSKFKIAKGYSDWIDEGYRAGYMKI